MITIPEEVLNDVFSRFILPEANTNSDPIRLCFAVEMAHWFYLDYIMPTESSLSNCTVEVFARQCFEYMPSLLKPQQDVNMLLKEWKKFKKRVPVYGAMLVNPDKMNVLLVEGNSTRGCWTFPRGKIEESEDTFDCAVREVKEETSFNILPLADKNFYIEKDFSDRKVRLYIVHDVPDSTLFYTKVKGEIANFQWFPIDELPGAPGFKKKKEQFFMVSQFVREYIKGYRQGKKRNNASECEALRIRTRGASFNDGDNSHYNSRRDSYQDDRRREDTWQPRDNHPRDNFARDNYPRDYPWQHDKQMAHFSLHEDGYQSERPRYSKPVDVIGKQQNELMRHKNNDIKDNYASRREDRQKKPGFPESQSHLYATSTQINEQIHFQGSPHLQGLLHHDGPPHMNTRPQMQCRPQLHNPPHQVSRSNSLQNAPPIPPTILNKKSARGGRGRRGNTGGRPPAMSLANFQLDFKKLVSFLPPERETSCRS